MKVNQTQDDYKKHLAEQYQFLINSCHSFDSGFSGEAKRIAATMRVLLHDTKQSKSLLGQLGAKNIYYYNTASEYSPTNLLAHLGLVGVVSSPESTKYFPMLDDIPGYDRNIWVTFDTWWEKEIVLSDSKQNKFTRKQLVLLGSNKDGGAHIDPELDDIYAQLSRGNSVGFMSIDHVGQSQPLADPHLFSIRQMGHELIRTLENKFPELKN